MGVDGNAISEAAPAELVPAPRAGHVVAGLFIQLFHGRPAPGAALQIEGIEQADGIHDCASRCQGRRSGGSGAGKRRFRPQLHVGEVRCWPPPPRGAVTVPLPGSLVAVLDVRMRGVAALHAELVGAGRAEGRAAASAGVLACIRVEALSAARADRDAVVGPEREAVVALQIVEVKNLLGGHRLDLHLAVWAARDPALPQLRASAPPSAVRAVEVHPAEGLPRRQFERLDADRATARWNERRWWRRWG
mmetsp:Transcript_18693/g.56258  ORF Transcript_18693/g.56258 Transcript_18693/m.56258 type:complete len:248 (+) Transcript_18693:279-1022(+)